MLDEHCPVGVVEGVVLNEAFEAHFKVRGLSLFQLFNIRLPLEIPLLKTEILY